MLRKNYGKNENNESRITIAVNRSMSGDQYLGKIEISVIDNGPGINKDQMNLVTRRRSQGRAGQLLGLGSGLGLAIVNEYTRIMGTQLQLSTADELTQKGLKASIIFSSSDITPH